MFKLVVNKEWDIAEKVHESSVTLMEVMPSRSSTFQYMHRQFRNFFIVLVIHL